MLKIIRFALLVFVFSVLLMGSASATFSIVACEKATGRCGVAVATHNLAVGHGVPFAKAGVGAGVSQFETNPVHMSVILNALEKGETAEKALDLALSQDDQYLDGNDTSFRQIGIVGFNGTASAYTGQNAIAFSGHRANGFVSVQGNGLASNQVLSAMWECFHKTKGSLEERLITALEAGYKEGGQTIGITSAALLVSTPEGWPVDVDYRVDLAPNTAIADLRKTFDAGVARQMLFRARRFIENGQASQAEHLINEALERAPDWDRIWLNAAWIAEETGNPDQAAVRFCRFKMLNPTWAELLSNKKDFSNCE